jgi:AcrR family transcriptional regulator
MAKETNRERALAALVESASIAEAAKRCKLSKETLFRYLRDESFVSEYRAFRRVTVENAVAHLQVASGEAVETLRRNLTCENPAAQIRAAQLILDFAVKGVEVVDLAERLERLEDAAQRQIKEIGKSNFH